LSYMNKEIRLLKTLATDNPTQNELSIQAYYQNVTSEFCVSVASTLAIHPHIWQTVIEWVPVPIAQGDAVGDGSLKLLFSLNNVKRECDQTAKNSGPQYVDAELWQELMEVCNKYGDMAIWEMKSVSVGDGAFMLGVLALATGKEQFQWLTCKGGTDHTYKRKGHYEPPTIQLEDDPEIMSKFGLDDLRLDSNANADLDVDLILDEALRRSGSSLELVKKFDKKLMREAKGILRNVPKMKEIVEVPSHMGGDLRPGQPNSTPLDASQGEASSLKPISFENCGRSAFGKLSPDEQGLSSGTADSSWQSAKFDLPLDLSQTSTVKSSKGKNLKVSIFKLRRQNRSPSKSPRKQAHTSTKDKKSGQSGGGEEGEEECDGDGNGGGCERPLTAQHVLQQVSHLCYRPRVTAQLGQ
jgi:hypothetical protein